MRIKERSFCLRRGRCAWCDLREDRTHGCNNFFLRRQNSNRLENRNAQGSFSLDGGLVAQMAIRTIRVIRGIGMMPVADDAGGKYQKGDQRQRNPEYANRLAHCHFGGTVTWHNPLVIVARCETYVKRCPSHGPPMVTARRSLSSRSARPRNPLLTGGVAALLYYALTSCSAEAAPLNCLAPLR